MKLGWLADIHLNFLENTELEHFLDLIKAADVNAWLVAGDIGEADSVADYLLKLDEAAGVPIYFVLGNHDFYGSSLEIVRRKIQTLAEEHENLNYLSGNGPQLLTKNVALVGDDAWCDGRLGDPYGTPIELNDFLLIDDLKGLKRVELVATLKDLGRESAGRLAPKLGNVVESHDEIVILTHVTPFQEAVLYEGRPSSIDWLPWFSCQAIGEVIGRYAEAWPEKRFNVLCGHTHHAVDMMIRDNLRVRVSHAEYGQPNIAAILEWE